MNRVETWGLVLYNRNYRENDKLVKILTEKEGKRMFFVRHAHQSNVSTVIQPLVVANFILKLDQEGLGFIEDYRESQIFKHINGDIFKLSYASYLVSLTDVALQDNVRDPALFAFLLKTLQLMDDGLDEEILTNIFEVQVLSRFGIAINFQDCIVCHRSGVPLDFSSRYMGCLCPLHLDEDPNRSHLDPNLIYLLSRFQGLSFADLKSISVKPEMKRNIRIFLDHLYEECVGIHLKSKKFIDDLGSWGQLLKDNP